ncbi:MAG TPA: hypothetical protein VNF74_12320 [Terriglobales bacterium]|nr:hypothetical protein [Terriglobales bacterium]
MAPITRQSGKSGAASMRRACCHHALRNAVYHWSRVSVLYDPRSKAHYTRLRLRGHSHGRALRGVADRLLQMLYSMLRSQDVFDPNRRHPPPRPARPRKPPSWLDKMVGSPEPAWGSGVVVIP